MKRSELYLRAAERLAADQDCACCAAIGNSTGKGTKTAEMEFAAYFKPDYANLYWWGNCNCFSTERVKRERILCFMAAIAERP